MPIDSTTLRLLDPNKSYYLSNTTGEIKEAGVIQKLRCLFGVGGGRAKAAALAQRVKTALLAEAETNCDSQLETDIGALDTNYSLSGRKLRDIANKFAIKVAARRAVENYADTKIEGLVAEDAYVHPDPVSKDFLKKMLVYAAAPVIQEAARECRSVDMVKDLVDAKKKSIVNFRFFPALAEAAQYAIDHIPDFPAETLPNDWPAFKLDELHFRVILACIFSPEGELDLVNLNERLARLTENDIQALKAQILAVPLKAPTDPNAVPEFCKAMDELFYNNRVMQGNASGSLQGNGQGGVDLRNIEYMG